MLTIILQKSKIKFFLLQKKKKKSQLHSSKINIHTQKWQHWAHLCKILSYHRAL